MASKGRRHTHKYYRAHLTFADVWACALPDCTHYMPEHMSTLMNGKRSICWKCNEPMLLHPLNLTMERPVCDECKLGIKESTDVPMSDVMRAFLEKKVG